MLETGALRVQRDGVDAPVEPRGLQVVQHLLDGVGRHHKLDDVPPVLVGGPLRHDVPELPVPEFVEDQVVLVLGDRDLEQSHTAGTPPAWENLVQDSQNTILRIRVARRTRDRSGET
ncbi:hypothetical protein BRC83_09370 [Halobacteriales archaeon QS_1_68_17]|nr:MAG: hypothetical protein BRC83_09370 [Halobacteriales archaeon QS_1_68_17]